MEDLKLHHIIATLNQCSVESVQSGNGFTDIDRYLHTERTVTNELIEKMIEINNAGGGIILLVGSAGDGKSHLLSKIKDLDQDNWPLDAFYNDATASCSPNKTAIDTLKEALVDFSDVNIGTTTKRKILAINLGKLNAFIDDPEIQLQYAEIARAVRPLFEGPVNDPVETDRIKIIEFSNKQIYEFYPSLSGYDALKSDFMSQILEKIVSDHPQNPFFQAFTKDIESGEDIHKNPIMINFQLLMLPEVRKSIILYVIEAIIRFNLSITPREFLDFIHSIIIPINYTAYKEDKSFYEFLLPSLLFSGGDNAILKALSKLDPLKHSSTIHDSTLSLLFTSNSIPDDFFPTLSSTSKLPTYVITRTNQFYDNNGRDIERTTKFLFRLKHLLSYHSESETYKYFIDSLKTVFSEDINKYDELYQLVSTAIPRHYGSYMPQQDSIPLNIQGGKYKMFASLQMNPATPIYRYHSDKPNEFYPNYKLIWEIPLHENKDLVIDYSLYSYLYDLSQGKLAIAYENDKNMRFGNFVRYLASISEKTKMITVSNSEGHDITMRESFNRILIQ
ncbi:MAG: DNA phosphorothioation-dependent restriction protein DptF [Lachnospiraceae bacterium]|nr:DNA phosphorothioation-dependent restriction protein DptF [Lachnospiraceae bacterium]